MLPDGFHCAAVTQQLGPKGSSERFGPEGGGRIRSPSGNPHIIEPNFQSRIMNMYASTVIGEQFTYIEFEQFLQAAVTGRRANKCHPHQYSSRVEDIQTEAV